MLAIRKVVERGLGRGLDLLRVVICLFEELELVVVSGIFLLLAVAVLLCIELGQLVAVVLGGIDCGLSIMDLQCSSNLFSL